MSIKDSQDLKNLQSRKAKLESDLSAINIELQCIQNRKSDVQKSISNIVQQIQQLSQSNPIVTEHAIVRYLQRIYNLDLEVVKNEIMPADIVEKIKWMGNGKLKTSKGFSLIIRDKKVITVED